MLGREDIGRPGVVISDDCGVSIGAGAGGGRGKGGDVRGPGNGAPRRPLVPLAVGGLGADGSEERRAGWTAGLVTGGAEVVGRPGPGTEGRGPVLR